MLKEWLSIPQEQSITNSSLVNDMLSISYFPPMLEFSVSLPCRGGVRIYRKMEVLAVGYVISLYSCMKFSKKIFPFFFLFHNETLGEKS